MSKPPRSAMTLRDMLVALAVLGLVALVVGGLTRACSFAPGGAAVDPNAAPTIDASADLKRYAAEVTFPVRVPAVPPGWRATTSGLDPVGGGRPEKVVRVGYLSPDGRYLRLLQGDVPEETMLTVETGPNPVPARGPVDVDGTQWVVYGAQSAEPIWIASAGGARFLVTGSGSEADFRALAAAALAGEPVHR